MKHQSIGNKGIQTSKENDIKQMSSIQEKIKKLNAVALKIPISEESLNWGKIEKLPYQMEVFFSRPMKNIEYEKYNENTGTWSAYYNVQLPTIIAENQTKGFENDVVLKVVQVTQLNGEVIKCSELAGDDSQYIQSQKRTELKGLKLNTPQKLQNKKKCIHHIALCAFQKREDGSYKDLELIGISICGGFSLKSRKKSHQEKGLDTSYFKPIELTQNLHQRKCKQQPILISNSIEGLLLYFTSPNIRHKIQNTVKKICTEFSKCQAGNDLEKEYSMSIVIDDTGHTGTEQNKEDQVQRQKKVQKILKALECTKGSKCLYYLKSEQEEMKESSYYHFETQNIKDKLISIYKQIYQIHSGVSEKDWYQQDPLRTSQTSPNSTLLDNCKVNRKRTISSVIDVNQYRDENNKYEKFYIRIQVQQKGDNQSSLQHQESFKNMMSQCEDEQQSNSQEMLSQIISTPPPLGNQNSNLEHQINIKYEAVPLSRDDQLEKKRYQNFLKQEENDLSQNSTAQDLKSQNEKSMQKLQQPLHIKNETQLVQQHQQLPYDTFYRNPIQGQPLYPFSQNQQTHQFYQYQQPLVQFTYQQDQQQFQNPQPYYQYNNFSNYPVWKGYYAQPPTLPSNQNSSQN